MAEKPADEPQKKIILLVDNDKNTHRFYDEEFSDVYGNKVSLLHFHSPAGALDYLNTNKAHLVISGIIFPDIDGISFLKECKSSFPQLPFVINTSLDYSDNLDLNEYDAYVAKNSDSSELFNVIEGILNI